MSKGELHQGISLKIVVYDRVRTDGTSPIYLRITIDRKKRDLSLKCYWPKENFDTERQIALPRHPKDADVKSLNMILEDVKGRANRIKLRYFTDNKKLTLDQFAIELDSYDSRDNFLLFWDSKLEYLANESLITKSTYTNYKSNRTTLNEFIGKKGLLSMADINKDFVNRYFQWLMKKKKLKYNSAVKCLKTMQTFFRMLPENGFKVDKDAFSSVPKTYREGQREVLEIEEISALQKLYAKNELPAIAQEVLRRYLFCCFTGLRISDSSHVSRDMIHNGKLTVKMKKGERYGKEVTLKLPDYALMLIDGRKGLLFDSLADQTVNRWLKVVFGKAGIDKEAKFHSARDTFATTFIALGGDIGVLKDLLGHSVIRTTQIYIKKTENRADKLMDNFNQLTIKPE